MGDLWNDGIAQALTGFPLSGKVPNRVGLLKGAGNSIVPQVAAVFIKSFMDS
jgi:DNA (cytosine-5)-methyltransferase 1